MPVLNGFEFLKKLQRLKNSDKCDVVSLSGSLGGKANIFLAINPTGINDVENTFDGGQLLELLK
jgi:hypothetical protein